MSTETLRMTQRSRNGARSRKYHAVPGGPGYARVALCGARPNIGALTPTGRIVGAQGWGSVEGKHITCRACLRVQP